MKQQVRIVSFLLCCVMGTHASDSNEIKKRLAALKNNFEVTKMLQEPVCNCCGDCGFRNIDVITCMNCCASWVTGGLMWGLSSDADILTQLFNTLAGCSTGSYAIGPLLQEWYIAHKMGPKVMSENDNVDHDKEE